MFQQKTKDVEEDEDMDDEAEKVREALGFEPFN